MAIILPRRIGWGSCVRVLTSLLLSLSLWLLRADRIQAAPNDSKGTPMTRIEEQEFGKMPAGTVVKIFTLRNEHGMLVKVMSYGAIITQLQVPDRAGTTANVILGADTFEAYLKGFPASAAVI